MPKRTDLRKILIIGSGPIIIGQGCEFDYSGVQACKALRAEGYEIVLVNSNPATIMTDPEMADHTYIEPINWQTIEKIIQIEQPHAILSTMGGQTALNCALELEARGILQRHRVELIGANKAAIEKAEDRALFRNAMQNIGLETPRSFIATDMQQARSASQALFFPLIIRPSYTLGGSGGGIAYNEAEFERICTQGLALSRNHQLLIEESLIGWKEFELEVVRDANDTCIIVCTIENVDPMGVHTGDSITVAPAQTLTDQEYQKMRNAAIAILREIGVETGGSNVQFAIHPSTGRMIVIEMNPRVSRSSALASKATGFPIAKVAALLAVGYTLDELQNDITGGVIPASFEPSIDYVVVKIPRFNFDKFPAIKPMLGTQMQAVGEVMAIGATFCAALQKALCGLEVELTGFNSQVDLTQLSALAIVMQHMQHVGPLRILYVADAFRLGMDIKAVHSLSAIDPWFLTQIKILIDLEQQIQMRSLNQVTTVDLLKYKQVGFSDARLAQLLHTHEQKIRELRLSFNIKPKFKRIDSCAAEFPTASAYLYATYEGECESEPTQDKKVIVLGSGPNRIGQGIEFDYCCVQAVQALQQNNMQAIMINCNPETVSTDYDISDRLYFESLTLETVLDIIEVEQPLGVILQFGGQTPLKLAAGLHAYGVSILGTSPDTIDLAEDRGQFVKIIHKLGLQQPANAMAVDLNSALIAANTIGYPLMLRPSYVLGGSAMEIVNNAFELQRYLENAFAVANNTPVLIDRFVQNAIEVDVDVVADQHGAVWVAGIMQHIEPAGVHSGDSASCLPPFSIDIDLQEQIKAQAIKIALQLKVVGLMNVQFALQGKQIFILEVNPRAARTVPFVSKFMGKSLAKIAVDCMLGKSLDVQRLPDMRNFNHYAVKQSVFPFVKFLDVDPLLGPQMRSTGEIMAFGHSFCAAYKKSLEAIGFTMLEVSKVYLSVADGEIEDLLKIISLLTDLKIEVLVCQKTEQMLNLVGHRFQIVDVHTVLKFMENKTINLVINTIIDKDEIKEALQIRASAIRYGVNCITTLASAQAMLMAINFMEDVTYKLQAVHDESKSCIFTN